MRHIQAAGPVGAFATPFSNYSPPYLYLLAAVSPLSELLTPYTAIKLLSCGSLVALAMACHRLLALTGHPQPARAAALVGLTPTLFVNPAVLNQCDGLWVAALLMAVTCAVGRRHERMLMWCGVALSIKAQAAFAAPFFLALVISRQVPPRQWLLAPLAFVLMLAPAWTAGWPAADLLTIYFRQAEWSDRLAMNAPNIWMLAEGTVGALPPWVTPLATAMTLGAIAIYLLVFARRLANAEGTDLLAAALICALIVPGLLPRMHERFFFLADVLALLLCLSRTGWGRPAVYTQLGSGCAILAYLSGVWVLAVAGALFMLAATWFAIRYALPLGESVKGKPQLA
jgi:Gpi18-like mannosyltransferase